MAIRNLLGLGKRGATPSAASNEPGKALKECFAATAGHDALTLVALGRAYETGAGVRANRSEALRCYRLAAGMGDVTAQVNLARMLAGPGGDPGCEVIGADLQEARQNARRAAESGTVEGFVLFADLLSQGIGGPAEPHEAVLWYHLAASEGSSEAAFKLARLLSDGTLGRCDHAKARRWLEQAARDGHVEAMVALGLQLGYGIGGPASPRAGLSMLMKAAERRNVLALRHLGLMVLEGHGCEVDPRRGVAFLTAAMDRGDVEAALRLGHFHRGLNGRKSDPVAAIRAYRRAMDLGSAEARSLIESVVVESRRERGLEPDAGAAMARTAVEVVRADRAAAAAS